MSHIPVLPGAMNLIHNYGLDHNFGLAIKVFYDRPVLKWVFAPQLLVTKFEFPGGSLLLCGVCVGFKVGPVM